ncbi:MAG: hypothetical protein MI975_13010 [Cytophagales bacterium]|nr:hypothetical protein [Cytophagales bacterium]
MEMKQNIFFRLGLFIIPVVFFLGQGCKSQKSKEEVILGTWKAHWETKADENLPGIDGESLKMNGEIQFMKDGKVEISAFGFDGCIFSDDTLNNILNWKLDDTILRFIDKADDHGLPYSINEFSADRLHLTLLEDINLTLVRN